MMREEANQTWMRDSTTIVSTRSYRLSGADESFLLDCGRSLPSVTVAYETYGELNAARDNAVVICHALTGNAHAAGLSSPDPKSAGWWDPMVGPGKAFDTRKYYVVCSNILGSCYGTTGPASLDPATGSPYAMGFPQMTVRDMVRLQHALAVHLGIREVRAVIGGSLGGMQVLEWALMYPEMVRSIIPIGTAARHSPWCIGLNDIARQAITNDPNWREGDYYGARQPERGLSLARQVAMMSYRSDVSFLSRFGRERRRPVGEAGDVRFDFSNLFQVESYLHYQGEKLVTRFDANSYIYISRAMDLHDVAFGRGDLPDVLSSLRCPALCIGISSDVLYPVHEQKDLAEALGKASYAEIDSPHGHDAFLIEYDQLTRMVTDFTKEHGL
jgi:homoserine O-acetyltransferase